MKKGCPLRRMVENNDHSFTRQPTPTVFLNVRIRHASRLYADSSRITGPLYRAQLRPLFFLLLYDFDPSSTPS